MPAPQASPLLAGERSLRPHLWQLASTAGIVVAGVVGYAVTPLTGDRSWLGAVLALGAIGVIAPLTVRRVRAVVTSDQPVLEAIQAADRPLPQLVIPVPLHLRRLAERGYNQSLELARPIAKSLSLPLETRLIQRTRHTKAQRTLNARTRQRNLERAFAVDTQRLEQLHFPAHVALVDDVLTTGATVGAIASLLQRHGVTDIDVWCVARTP